jgi:hypothetical protein
MSLYLPERFPSPSGRLSPIRTLANILSKGEVEDGWKRLYQSHVRRLRRPV